MLNESKAIKPAMSFASPIKTIRRKNGVTLKAVENENKANIKARKPKVELLHWWSTARS